MVPSPIDTEVLLNELHRINDTVESMRSELVDIKTTMGQLKSMQETIGEIKEWKKNLNEVVSPTQLAKVIADVDKLKTFQTMTTTIGAILYAILGYIIYFVRN